MENKIDYKQKYLETLITKAFTGYGVKPMLYRGFLISADNYYQKELVDEIVSIKEQGYTLEEITEATIQMLKLKETYKEGDEA